MKKILYVTTVSRTINAFLIPHIKMLIEEGNIVDVACSIDKEINKELIDMGSNIYEIPFSRNPINIKNITAYKEIKKLVKTNNYDIVHVHTPVASFVTRLSLRNEKIKMIYTAHGFHFYKGASFLNWMIYYPLEKLAAKWTDILITINNEDFQQASKFKFRNKDGLKKINGIGVDTSKYKAQVYDKALFRKNLNLKKDDFVITVVAELIKRKNHMQIIKTIEELKDSYPNIKLLIAGDGILTEKIKKYIDEKNLKDNIYILGYRTDINKIIGISNLIGLFSVQEGLPRNLMEAMAIGKPIVCTDIRGNNDLVNEDVGILVPLNNIKETKSAILNFYNNKEIACSSEFSKKNSIKKYDIENVLEEMREIFRGNNE